MRVVRVCFEGAARSDEGVSEAFRDAVRAVKFSLPPVSEPDSPGKRGQFDSGPPQPCSGGQAALVNGPPALLGWAGSENPGSGPPLQKGPPHALSNAVRWPKMAHREWVPRTGPRNRNLLGFQGVSESLRLSVLRDLRGRIRESVRPFRDTGR